MMIVKLSMQMAEESINKLLYKITLKYLRELPLTLALCYMANSTLAFFGYHFVIFSLLGGTSFLMLGFLFLTSYAFKFCKYHRVFLYFILFQDILTYADMWLDLDYRLFFGILILCFGYCLVIYVYMRMHHEQCNIQNGRTFITAVCRSNREWRM